MTLNMLRAGIAVKFACGSDCDGQVHSRSASITSLDEPWYLQLSYYCRQQLCWQTQQRKEVMHTWSVYPCKGASQADVRSLAAL